MVRELEMGRAQLMQWLQCCGLNLLKGSRWSRGTRVRAAGAGATASGTAKEVTRVLSQGKDSDSSYAVSGISSAGTAKDTPSTSAKSNTSMERDLVIGVLRWRGRCSSVCLTCVFGRPVRLRGCHVPVGGSVLQGGER